MRKKIERGGSVCGGGWGEGAGGGGDGGAW